MNQGDRVIRGREKLLLIRELADGTLSQAELAEKFGRSQPGISAFAKRNADAIAKVREDIGAEIDVLWVSHKADRIATYEGYIEQLAEIAELVEHEKVPTVLKTAANMIRNVAEELGHLAPKDAGEATKVEVTIKGVDGDAL